MESARHKEYERTYKSKVIYEFENGYHIYNIPYDEIQLEGHVMANCLANFDTNVEKKYLAILALRDSSRRSIANIQVFPNGSIGQNFEKSNRQVKISTWKYISEFFKKNSKDLSIVKGIDGESKLSTIQLQSKNLEFPMMAQGIPDSIKIFINKDGEIKKMIESMQFTKIVEGTKFPQIDMNGSAEEIISILNETQKSINQAIDRLKFFAQELEDCNLFLNDEMKEKIFGKNLTLKGEIKLAKEVLDSFKIKNRRQNGNRAPQEEERPDDGRPLNRNAIIRRLEARDREEIDEDGHPDEELIHQILDRLEDQIDAEFNEMDDMTEDDFLNEEEI